MIFTNFKKRVKTERRLRSIPNVIILFNVLNNYLFYIQNIVIKAEGEKTMKKKLALLLATVMAATPLSALNVSVGAAEEPDIYADVYGIEVEFGDVPEDADIADLTLTKVDGEENVAVTWASSGTKRTIKTVDGSALEVDEPYRLSFGTTEREFMIKTIFFEDFNDTSVFATQDVLDTTPFEYTNSYGDIEVSYGTKGAFIKDGKVWVTDGALTISNLDTFDDLTNTTLMADVAGYAKYYKQGTAWRRLPSSVSVRMLSRAQDANAGASGVQFNQENFELVSVQDGGAVAEIANTLATYPNDENYDFGQIAELTGSARTQIVNKDTDITGTDSAASDERAVALRTNKKSITAFADTASTTYSDDSVSDVAGNYVLGLTFSGRGIAVLDNVKITAYTEDVEDITGELEPVSLENDNYEKLVLTFNKRLRDLAPSAFETLQVLKDGVDITATTTIAVDTEDDTKLNITPAAYSAGYTYTVVVPEGFGIGSLLATQEYTPSVNVEATPIAVQNFEFKPSGIEITFDTDLTDITDDADLASVSVQIGDANCENFAADAGATVTKDGTTLTIVPSTYAVNRSYKVVIPQGFGDTITQLTQEYEHTQLFERIPVEVKKIYGNAQRIDVELTSPIDKDDPTLNLDNIKICEIVDGVTGAPETIAPSITTEGNIHIQFPAMELDKIYEVYIPSTVGTETVGLAHSIRKKFTQTTIAFENYENDGQSFGAVGAAFTKSPDPDGNDYAGYTQPDYWNTLVKISNDEIDKTENYTMEFDYQVFFRAELLTGNTANAYGNEYNKATRSAQTFYFNKQGGHNPQYQQCPGDYVSMTFREDGSAFGSKCSEEAKGTVGSNSLAKVTYTNTRNGDAVKRGDSFHVYSLGEPFDNEITFRTTSGETVSTCQRAPQPSRLIRIIKTGAHFTIYREDENGQMALIRDVDSPYLKAKTGHVEVGGDGIEILSFDNIRFSVVKFIEETEVGASDLVITTPGDISTQTTIHGTYTIKNATNSDKDICAVVVGYNADGSMLCADLDATTSIAPGEEIPLDFDLINLTGTTSIKLFLWDNLTNKALSGVFDFPIAP